MVAFLCVILGLALMRFAIGVQRWRTVYFTFPWGFLATGGPRPRFHEMDRRDLSRVIDRLLVNDLYDLLHVSRTGDEHGGVTVCLTEGRLELDATFGTLGEGAELSSFIEAMSAAGFDGDQDSDGYNGGFGEESRVTTVAYTLPHSTETIMRAIDAALANLEPGNWPTYFASGSSFKLNGLRWGIQFGKAGDPIAQILATHVDI